MCRPDHGKREPNVAPFNLSRQRRIQGTKAVRLDGVIEVLIAGGPSGATLGGCALFRLFRLLSGYAEHPDQISKLILDFELPVVTWPQPAVHVLYHLAGSSGCFLPSCMLVIKLFADVVYVRNIVMYVEKIARHNGQSSKSAKVPAKTGRRVNLATPRPRRFISRAVRDYLHS
jgi:hypothetical protein